MNAPAMTPLTALIARVEALTGPDREVDAEIWMTLNPDWRSYVRTPEGGWFHPHFGKVAPAGDYTGSLDDALTLVPEGWSWRLDGHRHFLGRNANAALYKDGFPQHFTVADTPAIALTLAALKALEARR